MTFRQWARQYLALEPIKNLRGYESRRLYVEHLVRFFGAKALGSITPDDVTAYRAQRVQYRRVQCPDCQAVKETCKACGWKRDAVPLWSKTIPAAHVPKPNAQMNENALPRPKRGRG